MKKFAIIGLGSRGQMFAKLLEKEKDVILTAVAEPVYASRQLAFTRFGVPLSRCYEDADELFAQGIYLYAGRAALSNDVTGFGNGI